MAPGKVFIANLPINFDVEEVCGHFCTFGTIMDSRPNRERGFMHILYKNSNSVQLAIDGCKDFSWHGRVLGEFCVVGKIGSFGN